MVGGRYDLKDKMAVVTGGSRGIGRAIAVALAEAGATVVVASRRFEECRTAADYITDAGGAAMPYRADISSVADSQELIDFVVGTYSRIDILVNNAGTAHSPRLMTEVSESLWDKVWDLNVKGMFFCSQAAAKDMIPRRSGKIINVASMAAAMPSANLVPYVTSKGAVAQLTKAMALDLAPFGINVNAVGPNWTLTDLTSKYLETEEGQRDVVNKTPLGRAGTPEDTANAVLFLASSAADFITGQILFVDGGWVAGK